MVLEWGRERGKAQARGCVQRGTPEASAARTFLSSSHLAGWGGGGSLLHSGLQECVPQGSVGRSNYKESSGSLQIGAQSTRKPAPTAAQGGAGGPLGGMWVGRLMFELWLYSPSTEWPWHRAIRLGKEMHTYVYIHVYFSTAWLVGHNREKYKVRPAKFLGMWDRADVCARWEDRKANGWQRGLRTVGTQ